MYVCMHVMCVTYVCTCVRMYVCNVCNACMYVYVYVMHACMHVCMYECNNIIRNVIIIQKEYKNNI